MEWNGTKILVWNTEDARMEWKISKMEWKTIFHTNSLLNFDRGYLQKKYIWIWDSDKSEIIFSQKCSTSVQLFVDKSLYFDFMSCVILRTLQFAVPML